MYLKNNTNLFKNLFCDSEKFMNRIYVISLVVPKLLL